MLNYGNKELRELILLGVDEEQKMLQSFIIVVEGSWSMTRKKLKARDSKLEANVPQTSNVNGVHPRIGD